MPIGLAVYSRLALGNKVTALFSPITGVHLLCAKRKCLKNQIIVLQGDAIRHSFWSGCRDTFFNH